MKKMKKLNSDTTQNPIVLIVPQKNESDGDKMGQGDANPNNANQNNPYQNNQNLSIEEIIGNVMKNSENFQNLDQEIVEKGHIYGMYNFHETTFINKMITGEIFGKINKGIMIVPQDYFRSLVFLSYFYKVLVPDEKIFDDLVVLSKIVKNDDPLSSLKLEAVVFESGLILRGNENQGKTLAQKKMKENYQAYEGKQDTRPGDNYYSALGKMVSDMVDDERRKYFVKVKTKSDIQAMVFIGSVYKTLGNLYNDKKISESLDQGEYLKASILCLDEMKKKCEQGNLLNSLGLKNDK
jgi:hypothetical protein